MLDRLKKLSLKVRSSEIARGTLWMMLSNGLRLGIQAGYFILVARGLGVKEYGELASISALVTVTFPFSGIGSGEILLRSVSRDSKTFPQAWGYALAITILSSVVLTGLLVLVSRILLPQVSSWTVGALAIADLLFFRLITTASLAFMGFSKMRETAYLNLMPGLIRLGVTIAFVFLFTHHSTDEWALLYLIATATSASLCIEKVWAELGKPEFSAFFSLSKLWDGLHFSIGLSAQGTYNDIDKLLLANIASSEITGAYAAAYRIIDVSFVSVKSLLLATFSKFFKHGADGIVESFRFAKRTLPVAMMLGGSSSIALLIISGAIPFFLGQGYATSVEVIQWLAVMPLIKSVHYIGGDALMGANLHGTRSMIQIGIAVLNFLLNLWVIPLYSWQGAAVVSLISDSLLALIIWSTIIMMSRRQIRQIAKSNI
ncbi:oligosaccharide flippase family protein [Leptolyngbya boryana CZ1]|uniref:Oligosaccharide flippase family protein n=1 Tax=Leptolyngbya boryana CZ1 TaxID=3060204 RepID=A0AA96X0L6_LEPBY|nr:oligosaccharide flippase family protein [Leptolyngbya boryana]WNZ47624.1 oligosaccharide flippase family protein [Leptolyngbya boryana CZ1]